MPSAASSGCEYRICLPNIGELAANPIDSNAGNAMPMKQPGTHTINWSDRMYFHQPRHRRRLSGVIGNTAPM